jgi:hypothetical protein
MEASRSIKRRVSLFMTAASSHKITTVAAASGLSMDIGNPG